MKKNPSPPRPTKMVVARSLFILCAALLFVPTTAKSQFTVDDTDKDQIVIDGTDKDQVVIDGTEASTTPKTDQQKMLDNKQRLMEMVQKRKEELARQTELRRQQEEAKAKLSGDVKISSPPPTSPVSPNTGTQMPPAVTTQDPASTSEGSPSGASVAANIILMVKPFNQTVSLGEKFLTEVCALSQKDLEFDEIRICINYPRHDVKPLQIFDFPIKDNLYKDQPATIINNPGLLTYSVKLRKPITAISQPTLLNIVWEATRSTNHAELALTSRNLPDAMQSGLFSEEVNILEAYSKAGSACIGASVAVSTDQENTRRKINVWRIGPADGPDENIPVSSLLNLSLIKPQHQPKEKGEFILEVYLTNPNYLAFDELFLAIGFDKKKAKVIDWDYKGWIQRGVNVFDANAHEDFPFNIHTQNEVRNDQGRITYKMGNSVLAARPSGCLVRIHGKELAPGGAKTFTLFSQKQDDRWFTDIRAEGASLLKHPDKRIAGNTK